MNSLLLLDVEIDGQTGLDVEVTEGRVRRIGPGLRSTAPAIDARGGALLPGLHDHHIHLLASAAETASIRLDDVVDRGGLAVRIAAATSARPEGSWLRATGYHEGALGDLRRSDLDALAPRHPLKVQHRGGALWVLNSAALDRLGIDDAPPGLETDAAGRPTGRLWRGDAWLRARAPAPPPPLAPLGQRLAALGLTGVCDASATTGASAAALLADAVRSGDLPLRLQLMSGGELGAPDDGAFSVGPVKLLLDERDLPDLGWLVARIGEARAWGRRVAIHCVTATELALALAALDAAGARRGDRLEHGSVIPEPMIAAIAALGLTVVTQPAFLWERGDRYLAEVDRDEQDDLYRAASLVAGGVALAFGSDAPYATANPWQGIRAACGRHTRGGASLGPAERLSPAAALGAYLAPLQQPGGSGRRIAVGAVADLCVLRRPLGAALDLPDPVAATILGGRIVYAGGLE